MKCANCGCEIEVDFFTGWSEGHNGVPLVDGRVCDLCNMKVIELRIKEVMKDKWRTK